jgi:vitamin B12 transporter
LVERHIEENPVTYIYSFCFPVFASSREQKKSGFARRRKGAKMVALLLALLPSMAVAQTEEAEEPESDGFIHYVPLTYGREIIVSASGTDQRRSEVGQAISVVNTKLLETLQTQVISDVLRTLPGVTVARNGGVGAATSVFIRGGDSSQTLVLIDGVRINDPSSPNAAFDFGALLTGNIGRVEVLRGPNSVIYGSQAIGGVVNIVTAQQYGSFRVTARGEYGYRDTAQLQANVSGERGIVSGSLGGGALRTSGISARAGDAERDGYRNATANGSLLIDFSNAFELDFRGYYNRGKVEFDDGFATSPLTDPDSENEQFIGYIGINSTLLDGRLRNRLSYSRTDISRKGRDPVVPVTFNVNALKATLDRFEYAGSFDVIDQAKLIFGAEYERSFASTFFPANGPGAVPDQAQTDVISGYGQVIVKPIVGLTLTGGARYDDYSDYGGQTTFGANFAYTPNRDKTVIRGTYAEGFRAPTLTEALLPFGNTALKPETAKSFDVGIEQFFFGEDVSVSATYFNRRSRNLITFSFVTFLSENIAKARSEGLELGLAVRPTRTLSLSAAYSLIDATSRSPDATFGNQLARRPKQNVSTAIDWQSPIGLSLGASLTFTGHSFDNLANTQRLDGFTLLGVRAAYPITKQIELFGRIENLGDENYQTAAGFNSLGRNAYIGVRVKF